MVKTLVSEANYVLNSNKVAMVERMPEGKQTKFRMVVGVLIFVIYTLAAADRANIGFALPFIRQDFPMSNTEAGGIASAFLLAYALFQMPAGFAYSKWGVRKLFSISMVMTSVFTGLIGTSSSPFMIKLFRVGLGMSEAPLGVGIPTTINRWFPTKEKGTMAGIYMSAAKFGPVVVPVISAFIIQAFSWREIFYFFAIPGVFLSCIWYWLVKNDPAQSPYCSAKEVAYIKQEQQGIATKDIKKRTQNKKFEWLDKIIRTKVVKPIDTTKGIFCSWNIIGAAICFFCLTGIVNILLTWIPTYLMKVKHFPIMQMGIISAMPWIGGVAGNIIGGWCSDNIFDKRRKPTMMFTALSTCIMTIALLNAPDDMWILSGIFFVTGICLNIGYGIYVAYVMKLATKEKYPIAYSFVNTIGQLGGASAPLLSGMILDSYNWDVLFMFVGAYAALCFIVLLTVVEPIPETNMSKAG